MSLALLADATLVLLVIGLAVWINATEIFAAVIGYVAFGLLLALVWMRLAAADVALTEAAIGSGVTGAVLIAAAARLRAIDPITPPPGRWLRGAALLLSGLVTVSLALLVLWRSSPAPSLAQAAAAHLPALGMGNAVTGVLMGYRAFDTLLEKVVLVLALAGVWSLTHDRFWGGRPLSRPNLPINGALVLLARILPPIGIVVAIHMLWIGATDPGGAFQGGAILAAMWILVMRAGLRDAPPIRSSWLRISVTVGPITFMVVGLAGFALPRGFLSYPVSIAKPVIILIETLLMLSIAAILGLLVAGPAAREPPG